MSLAGWLITLTTVGLPVLATEHPVPLEKDIDAAKCLECHEAQSKGKNVHSAIALGCTSCHNVQVEGDVTKIELNQPNQEICFSCHEKSKEPIQHQPYSGGSCVRCHDPHVGDFPKQLRASTNDLCLSCHGLDQPGVKWDAKTQTISMLVNQTLNVDEYRMAAKIGIDKKHVKAHPIMGHPVAGSDPRAKDKKTEMTCLSCHQAHAGSVKNLLPQGVKTTLDLCGNCHTGS